MLEQEHRDSAVNLRVYTHMALRFADMLSVITFSKPLLAIFQPII